MNDKGEQCRLWGLIGEELAEGTPLKAILVTTLSCSEDAKKKKRRITAAKHLIDDLRLAFEDVPESKRCHRTPAPTHACQCQLVWPSIDMHVRQAQCNGEELVQRIDERRDVFGSFLPADAHNPHLTQDQAGQLVWLLIPIIFGASSSTPVDQVVSLSSHQVRSDFGHVFHGSALQLLQHFIVRANTFINRDLNTEKIYAKTVPILQSSGTGKTKLVVQLSAHQAGMLVCTRRQNSLPTSFPPFDEPVYNYFRDTVDCQWSSQLSTKCRLTVQHKRLAFWLGAYFEVLADCLTQLKQLSGCFDAQGNCLHKDVERCWQTIVYDLACRIHRGADFIQDYEFQDRRQSEMRLCHESAVYPQETARPDSTPDTSFGSDTSLPSSQQQQQTSTSSISLTISLSEQDPRFRTRLLRTVTQKAQAKVKAADQNLDPDEDANKVKANLADSHLVLDEDVESSKGDSSKGTERTFTTTRDTPTHATRTSPQANKEKKPAEIASQAVEADIHQHLEQLEDILPRELAQRGNSFFFLAVDEVVSFHSLLPVLRRLWRESKPKYTWLILIDTESSIAHLAGDGVVDASLRLGDEEGKVIVPPFTYLPFDVHLSFHIKHNELLQQVRAGSLTFGDLYDKLRWFGRPLWGTGQYYQSQVSGDKTLCLPHLANILKKLFIGRVDSSEFWPIRDAADSESFHIVMAAVGQRLPLFFVGHQGARISSSRPKDPEAWSHLESTQVEASKKSLALSRAFLQRQVSSYLRIVSEVNRTESYVTATPSEPSLSLAVASEFRGRDSNAVETCKDKWSHAVQVLAQAHRSVGMMLGDEGEECMRLLITAAADLVAARRVQHVALQDSSNNSKLRLFQAQCDPVCLKDWLEMLFKQDTDNQGTWCKIQPDFASKSGRNLQEWASDYYLNFTHFVQLGLLIKPDMAPPAFLVEHWFRQAAVYGVKNQNEWDILIPIYRSTASAPTWSDAFDPNQISYVAIQVKNCYSSVTATDRFGPSCFYPAHSSTSADSTASAGTADLWPLIQDDCLEIFFDLRGVSGFSLRDFTEERPTCTSKKGKSEGKSTAKSNQDTSDVVMVEATCSPAHQNVVPADGSGAGSPGELDEGQLRPNNCFNLVVSGTSAEVLPIIKKLDQDARNALRLLFAFDDDQLQQNWKLITKECTSARGDPITHEFESVARVLHGFGRNHFLPEGAGKTPRQRGKTSIPVDSKRAKKRALDDDRAHGGSVGQSGPSQKSGRD